MTVSSRSQKTAKKKVVKKKMTMIRSRKVDRAIKKSNKKYEKSPFDKHKTNKVLF